MKRMARYAIVLAILGLMVVGCDNSHNPVESEAPTSLALWTLPGGATFESATLFIYVAIPSTQTVNVHRVTSAWEEMTVTWENFGSAFDQNIIGSFECDANDWRSVDVSSVVNAWLTGTYEDYGIILDQVLTPYPRGIYNSREAYFNEPYLEITYNLNGVLTTEHVIAEADAFISEENPTRQEGANTTLVTGFGADPSYEKQSLLWFDIQETVREDEGCTRSVWYWRNHSGRWWQSDLVSDFLPITVGNSGGENSMVVDDNIDAFRVLNKRWYGSRFNGITRLYAQLLAAKLNIANGASDFDIAETINDADAFVAMYDWHDWWGLDRDTKQEIRQIKRTLFQFNVGIIGPGLCHEGCGDDDEDQQADDGGGDD